MIEALKAYPAYADSGVPGFGKVPNCWAVAPLFSVARPKCITGVQDRQLLSVYLDRGVIPFSEVAEKRTNVTSEDLTNYQAVDPGDFVLNNQQAWRGSVGVSRYVGIVSPAYLVLTLSSRIRPAYANILLRTRAMVDQYALCSRGIGSIQRNLYWPHLRRASVLLPSGPEQAAIVRFIGHLDGCLHAEIRTKQRLVRLIEEQKQTLIDQVVTGKIDPRSREPYFNRRQSGVEWLGEVPEHWEVVRSKRLFLPRKELARERDQQLSSTQAYGVIPQAQYEERIGRRIVKLSMHFEKRRHVERDDFVISMRSFQGGLERAWASGAIRSSYVVLKPQPGVDTGFFSYLFKSWSYIGALRATADFIRDGQDLTYNNFLQVDLPLPSLDEQRQLAAQIAELVAPVDLALDANRREIDALREFQARLTADVVTGKLDVSEMAASLPLAIDEVANHRDEPGEDPDDPCGDSANDAFEEVEQ
jgi:type I restriction enzyme, S subunit